MDKTNIKIEAFISVVLALDDINHSAFEEYIKELQKYLEQRYSDYEVVIIDQNSVSISNLQRKHLLQNIPSIRWIRLAFPVELDVALNAGIQNAIGDFVLLLRPTIDPIEIISDMVDESLQGYDVIVGVAQHPRTLGYKIVRGLSNKLLSSIDYFIPKNAAPVRCLSRRAINTVLRTGLLNHQFFIKVANTGHPTKNYEYKLLNPDELKKRTLLSGIQQGLKLIVFNSTKPLQWIGILGIVGSLSAFIFSIYSIVLNLFKNNVVEGWVSMVFFSSFLFMILFIILAILGEYIARLFNESGNQQSYYISSEEVSAVMLDEDRFNVLYQS
jgi:polyisoprenyl-phosphate glycosyltransferase